MRRLSQAGGPVGLPGGFWEGLSGPSRLKPQSWPTGQKKLGYWQVGKVHPSSKGHGFGWWAHHEVNAQGRDEGGGAPQIHCREAQSCV